MRAGIILLISDTALACLTLPKDTLSDITIIFLNKLLEILIVFQLPHAFRRNPARAV